MCSLRTNCYVIEYSLWERNQYHSCEKWAKEVLDYHPQTFDYFAHPPTPHDASTVP